ncbi:MAG: FtsW/RodA/SpoVE family cell cycle protein [Flavobacteriales bacterium]|nr:FtsW/RodA/SpoVE family cell cycle protein [Flavobacteriales bacterium]
MKAIFEKLQGDRVIWMVAMFLSIISILAVYSGISTLAYKADGSTLKLMLKHSIMIGAGFVLMYYVHKIHFKYFPKFSVLLIWIAGILLLLTFFVGSNLNSADRWLPIPYTGLTFQPSDMAKFVLIIYVARLLHQRREMLDDFRNGVLPVILPVAIICGLILRSNFSTAFILAIVCLIMMFIAGVPGRHLFKLMGAGVGVILLIVAVGELTPADTLPRYQTWKNRIFNKVEGNDEGNYQVNIAKYAISEGGLFPSLPGSGSTRNFLPHPYSDMIYAWIIEEYGSLLGGIGVMMLYVILLFRSIRIASKCPKFYASLIAVGLSLLLVTQAMVNMAVAVDLFPTTGQPLPLVSLGGTSTIFTCLAIGLILSISRSVFNPELLDNPTVVDENDTVNNHPAVA